MAASLEMSAADAGACRTPLAIPSVDGEDREIAHAEEDQGRADRPCAGGGARRSATGAPSWRSNRPSSRTACPIRRTSRRRRRSRRRCGRRAPCRRRSRSSTGGSRSGCRRDRARPARQREGRRQGVAPRPCRRDRGEHANAGTTVAATMAIAARAGIEVFATGGIGGVHRGAEADLRHLRRPDRACAERRSRSSAPAASRSSTSPRRWSFWRRRACRWSATAPTSFPPSSRGRAATGSTIASTRRPRSRRSSAWSESSGRGAAS